MIAGTRRKSLGRSSGIRRAAKSRAGFTREDMRLWDYRARCDCLDRAGHRCEMADRPGHVCRGPLQDHHVIGRRTLATRWEPENHLALCAGAHKWWHSGAEGREQWDWFVRKYGEPRLERLNALRRSGRPDREAVKQMLGILE